ncbi:MAG TPA: PAS domain S-box protein [Verrucomicrobiae bacterium]|nr:PAS domain S-box protein [Verrucomicrobiae bacterium]
MPIRKKLMAVIMITSVTVVVLTVAALVIYDLATFRSTMVRDINTLARVVAENSTAAVAFKNVEDGSQILGSFRAEPQVKLAALYGTTNLFVVYPAGTPTNAFPARPEGQGYWFSKQYLTMFEPIMQNDNQLGTLYLKADLSAFYRRIEMYGIVAALIILTSVGLTIALSNGFQKQISEPILTLARAAKKISEQRDYSVRVPKPSGDELGALTEAFNHMLGRIEQQTVAIQESESRLRLALEASRIGTWDWNMESGKITWDDYNSALFGLKPGEFRGNFDHFRDLVHPDDLEPVERAISTVVDNKGNLMMEFRVIWPNGEIRDLFARGKVFFDRRGKPVRMAGVTLDITERKRGEESARRLAAIVESSDDAIVAKNLDGIITTWNKGAQQLLGFSAKEAIGQPITLVISPERHQEEQMLLERIRSGQKVEHFETQRQRKDGTILDVSLTVSPIKDAQDKIIGASSIARDITDVKRYQQALESQARMLREQAQMLDLANVMGRDLDDRIFLWNTGMEKMYGWQRTEMLGRVSYKILKTRFPKPIEEIRETLMREGQWDGEIIKTRKDGKELTVSSQWVLHRDHEGRPSAIIEVNTDITERKNAEQQVLRMNTELERRVRERTVELTAANQELEAFTYSVAHDLRAPLRHIDAFTKIILDDFASEIPEEARHYLDNIRKGSQNMSRLVDDLLNLARVSRQELKRELTPLKNVVDEVIGDLKHETENRKIEWRVSPLPTVMSDPGLMKQVFVNLLGNAVKYTRPRENTVIEIGEQHMGKDAVLYVRDNGVGFNMKYADKLFGVFQRLHRADEFEGTGVGLATVDRIIRKHGGRIWADSELGKGATFYFTFEGLQNSGNGSSSKS